MLKKVNLSEQEKQKLEEVLTFSGFQTVNYLA